MFRLTQLLQNTLLRWFGFFQQLFRNIISFFAGLFGGLARVLGFTEAGRFLEFEDAKGIRSVEANQPSQTASEPQQPGSTSPVRRRPDPNMDYFRNLAREIRTSN